MGTLVVRAGADAGVGDRGGARCAAKTADCRLILLRCRAQAALRTRWVARQAVVLPVMFERGVDSKYYPLPDSGGSSRQ